MRIDTTSGDFDYTYLSLGAGVQSSALLVLGCMEEVEKPDVAVFADTGDEPAWVLSYLKVLKEYAQDYGIAVEVAQKGVLSEWVLDQPHFVNIPLHTLDKKGNSGILRRQCTREFKITPINQKVRELLGYDRGQHMKHKVRAMLGITIDESQRMKPSLQKWVTNTYPLIDLGLHRNDCFKIIEDAGLPEPQKSACVYCPYHSDTYWTWMKENHPEEFKRAADFDEAIRNRTMKGDEQPAFVHRSCVPLTEAIFKSTDPAQTDMWGECEGMCGV
tara:strand:+ start:22 stop:840 length:819 start_codon:yes stop_codon:yes gene_type:complete